VEGLLNRDTYMLMADFADYVAAQRRVDALWNDSAAWNERAIHNVAAMGAFSSDRTIREYVDKIWVAPRR
ncbi:MAG: glycogen/starch/alpha-glucan phosphorylase, partial [Aquincola sp.]|nr:glycogen/starch/alpha-glucan phosphorylase [Aquincola sp.]